MRAFKIRQNTIIYCSHYSDPYLLHYTTTDKWEIYMRVRKHIPTKVKIFDRLIDLKKELALIDYYI